ncbi:malate dehydrogenase [Aureococcus anophagefferens]|nr:malate dehydrogenase [Aureococcus anophagefferens]
MSHAVATNTMMRLPASELMTMREEFEAEEDGLTLDQFVRVMLRRARHTSKRKYEKLARAKRMARRHAPADEEPAPTFESDDSGVGERRGHGERGHPAHGAPRGRRRRRRRRREQPSASTNPDAAPRSTVKDAVIECLDVVFAPKDELIIALCSDLTLRFYHMSSRQSVHEETVNAKGATRLALPHTRAAWWAGALLEGRHVGARLLFLAGPRATVTALAVRPFDPRPRPGADRDKGEPPGVTQLEGLHGHSDVVSDVVVLEQPRTIVGPPASGGAFGADDGDVLPREVGLLATASMDRTIKLWELPAMVCVSTLEGHSAGVRSLSYDRAQHVLLSAGFEFGVRAWGVSGHQAFPLFALEGGHATSVRSVCAAPGGSRSAVSLDDDGVLAWWDTSRDSASSASDRLTHAVTLSGDDCAVVVPVGFGVDVEMAQHKQREAARARSLELDKLAQRRQSLLDAKGGGSPLRPPTSGPRFESESLETEREALDAATASAAIAYSTNAISLACGGKRGVLRLLDANDHRDAEAPPTLVAYSPLTHEIVTAHGGAIKCWDVQMGLLKKEHSLGDGPRAADVSGLSFDARGRRLLVADRAGAVGIRRVRDAAPLMSLGRHRAEVAGLVYAPQDRVVVTVGWDRCLHVYDEREENPDDALLRAVANAHAADITGVALSRDTGLIATCDATGGMKLWDFGPGPRRGAGRVLVYTGDSRGDVQIFDIKPRLRAMGVAVVPGGDVRWRKPGYNCRRKLRRDHALSSFGDEGDAAPRAPPKRRDSVLAPTDPTEPPGGAAEAAKRRSKPAFSELTERRWTAHGGAVTCLLLVEDPPRLLTASADGSALRVLAAPGKLTIGERMAQTSTGANAAKIWRFLGPKDIKRQRTRARDRARDVLRVVFDEKREEDRALAAEEELARAKEETRKAERKKAEAAKGVKKRKKKKKAPPPPKRDESSVGGGSLETREDDDAEPIVLDDDSVLEANEAKRKQEELVRREIRKNELQQDPDDPDNWGIGSRNREQAMYGHLYKELKGRKRVETRNRAAVKPPGTAAHERALVRKLIEPSDFLKKQFGPGPSGAARRLREGRSIAPLSDLPPLDGQPEVATGVREKLGHWRDRVASRATEETSPRATSTRATKAPLPRAATEAVAAPLRHGHRQQYGPYPYANIDRFVGAYKACVAPSQRFGAPVAARAVLDHPVPSELSEVADGFLARNGVGPWARKAGGGERENELRAIFDLFDVDRAGAVDLRELADAVNEGSSALAGNEDWPALAGALFDHLAALERRAAPGGKARVSFDQFADIVQSAISTRD